MLEVTEAQCLSAAELQELGRFGRGVLSWWLLSHEWQFALIDLPRGDVPFKRRVLLPAGHYILGVGRGAASRRLRFEVTSDGSLVTPVIPRTEAHECSS